VTESCTIWSSRSRRPVRKLLDTLCCLWCDISYKYDSGLQKSCISHYV